MPGALGLLSAGAAALTAAVGALAAVRIGRRASPRGASRAPVAWDIRKVAAAAGVAATAAWVLGALFEVRLQAPMHVDALSFGLAGVAGWVSTGSIWHVGEFLPFVQVRTYPNNGDVLALATILPWRDDAFLRLLAPPLLALTGLAVYATGRELRAPASTAALFGAAVAATSAAGASALFDLKPDAVMYATFALGVLFAVRHARTGMRADLVLAGVGLGIALGSRWYGLTSVAVVIAVWCGALILARRPLRAVVRSTALVVGVIAAAGGFWLVRNAALTGNPLYPVDLGPLGLDAPRDIFTEKFGFTVAERLADPGFVREELLPSLWGAFGPAGAALLAGTAGALVLMVLRGVCARALALVAAAAVVAVGYALLPAGAQGFADGPFPGIVEGNMRWLMPAAILAAGPAAWAVGRLGRGGTAVDVALLACVVVTLHGTFSPEARNLAVGAVLAALGVAAAWGAWRVGSRGRGAAIGVTAVGAVALALVGYVHAQRYDRTRYTGLSAAVDWVHANAPADRRIGIAGNWGADRFVPIYPLFGPRLRNEVEYLGPLVDEQLREYTSAGPFIEALRRERYDLLAVGTLSRPDFEAFSPQRRLADPEEAAWARRAGYVEVARDADFVLLARRPR